MEEGKPNSQEDQSGAHSEKAQSDQGPAPSPPHVYIEALEPTINAHPFGNGQGEKQPEIGQKHECQSGNAQHSRQSVFATFCNLFAKLTTPEWIMAISGVVSSVVAVAALGVSYFGYRTSQAQLEEMKSTSTQTDSLINAATSQAQATIALADLTLQSIIMSQRARIAPIEAALDGPNNIGEPVKIVIYLVNNGKEVAENFGQKVEKMVFNVNDWNDGKAGSEIRSRMTNCMQASYSNLGIAVHPYNGINVQNMHLSFTDENLVWDKQILDGTKIMSFSGCFTYKTFDKIFHTSFCYYYLANSPTAKTLKTCTVGHAAD